MCDPEHCLLIAYIKTLVLKYVKSSVTTLEYHNNRHDPSELKRCRFLQDNDTYSLQTRVVYFSSHEDSVFVLAFISRLTVTL